MSTHARPLAEWLAGLSDDELTALFAVRGIRADAGWQDFFDAAETLLEPAALARVLPLLTSAEAAGLQRAAQGEDAGEVRTALTALALVDPDGTPWPPVAVAVAGRPVPEPVHATPPAPATESAAAHAAERAFTTVSRLADLLLISREHPFSLLTGGNVSAGEKRQLGEAGIAPEAVDALIAIAMDAGLAVAVGRRLRTTSTTDVWLRASAVERWSRIAEGFRAALPRGIRSADGGWTPTSSWALAHPWDSGWAERSDVLLTRAHLLGLIADDGSEPVWAAPLREGRPADTTELAALLPAEVDRIFLQNDLTAIAPGPLAPGLDVRLRTAAVRESAAQATSYRFTAESVAHALITGESADALLDFLTGISLTGIPQPLRYLIQQTAQRHGLVRVSADVDTGRTRVESVDAHLLETIAVDQALRPLALSRDVDALSTRVGRDTVYWALTDARYPATLVDENGAVINGERHPVSDVVPPQAPDHAPLIARLRAHQGPDADAAWLDRELESAVRARAVLRVSVGMPDGSTRELLLEATGLGGGRLRGRDRAADVERTLPVSSIRAASIVAQ